MEKEKQIGFVSKITLPEGVTAKLNGAVLTVKGPIGEVTRDFFTPVTKIKLNSNIIELTAPSQKRKFSRIFNTLNAHIKNLIRGAAEGFEYRLKICSGHFPITIKKKENEIIISNFLGEKIPRKSKILDNTEVEIKGEEIIVKSSNIEFAGQTAANLEKATFIKKRDRRIFQDGCYITSKPKKQK
jgi:large subunit ribosomal protein L6